MALLKTNLYHMTQNQDLVNMIKSRWALLGNIPGASLEN